MLIEKYIGRESHTMLHWFPYQQEDTRNIEYIHRLVQERRNFSAMELGLFGTNPSYLLHKVSKLLPIANHVAHSRWWDMTWRGVL